MPEKTNEFQKGMGLYGSSEDSKTAIRRLRSGNFNKAVDVAGPELEDYLPHMEDDDRNQTIRYVFRVNDDNTIDYEQLNDNQARAISTLKPFNHINKAKRAKSLVDHLDANEEAILRSMPAEPQSAILYSFEPKDGAPHAELYMTFRNGKAILKRIEDGDQQAKAAVKAETKAHYDEVYTSDEQADTKAALQEINAKVSSWSVDRKAIQVKRAEIDFNKALSDADSDMIEWAVNEAAPDGHIRDGIISVYKQAYKQAQEAQE